MGRLAPPQRQLAMRAYAASCYATSASPAAAAALFMQRYGSDAPARPARFCKKWGERWAASLSVYDAPRPGRPTKVSAEDAAAASRALKAGRASGGALPGYSSLAEAINGNATLKRILTKARCSARTLLRRMKQVDTNLAYKPVSFRPPLSAVNKQKRLAIARQHLRRWHEEPTYFRRVVFLDAAKIKLMSPAAARIWCDSKQPSSERVVTHPAMTSSGQRGKGIKLEYYAAVNTEVGPVDLIWCSTSSGSNKQFKASAARAHRLHTARPPACAVRRCRPKPTTAAGRSLGCTQQRLCGAAAGTGSVPGSAPPLAVPCLDSGCAAPAAPLG